MIKNYKYILIGLLISCSLLNAMDEQARPEEKQYVVLQNPALCPFQKTIIPVEVKNKFPKYTPEEKEIFLITFKAALVEIGLFEKDCSYVKHTGIVIVPSVKKDKPLGMLSKVKKDIVVPLESLKKAFEGVPNIYRIFNDYKKLENIIKKRDEEFGIKKKIGS